MEAETLRCSGRKGVGHSWCNYVRCNWWDPGHRTGETGLEEGHRICVSRLLSPGTEPEQENILGILNLWYKNAWDSVDTKGKAVVPSFWASRFCYTEVVHFISFSHVPPSLWFPSRTLNFCSLPFFAPVMKSAVVGFTLAGTLTWIMLGLLKCERNLPLYAIR